jgi:hypothetical protein
MKITVRYSSIDHFHKTRVFKTIEGAREFAVTYVGEDADIGMSYAVSFDGVGKVTVTGCTLEELFHGKAAKSLPYEVWYTHIYEEGPTTGTNIKESSHATLHEANQAAEELDQYCDEVRIVGTTDEAKAAITAQNEAYRAQFARDEEMPF